MKLLKNKLFYIGISILIIIIFLVQNTASIKVNFLFWNLIEINLLVVLAVFLLLGFLLGLYTSTKFKKKIPQL
jgi:uncharacterized integral membrane protein